MTITYRRDDGKEYVLDRPNRRLDESPSWRRVEERTTEAGDGSTPEDDTRPETPQEEED